MGTAAPKDAVKKISPTGNPQNLWDQKLAAFQ
jgi:hypothetical protein